MITTELYELNDKRDTIKKELDELLNKGLEEKRKLNSDETNLYSKKAEELRSIETKIQSVTQNNNNNKTITMEKFNLIKTINDVVNNRNLDDKALEVVNAGREEMRSAGQNYGGQIVLPTEYRSSILAGTATAGQEVIAEDKTDILEPLREKSVLALAGATFMTGLTGDVSVPVYSGSNCTWEDEAAAAKDGAGTFSEIKLSPKRLTAYVDISKQFLAQSSASAEAMLKNDIANAVRAKLEATVFGTSDGTKYPAGLFNAVDADTDAVTYKDLVDMEATLEGANVIGNKVFIVAPTAKATLKTTAKAANTAAFLMEDNEVIGYPALTSSAVASKGVVFGDFSDYVVAQWGGIDITVDPFSQAANGKVRLVVNAYMDAKPRRATSFVKKILK